MLLCAIDQSLPALTRRVCLPARSARLFVFAASFPFPAEYPNLASPRFPFSLTYSNFPASSLRAWQPV